MSDDIEADQTEIIAALASGAAVGERHPLTRIDTAMSRLFLGEQVYKLKRSRRHPFCDLSTPSLRGAACAAELAVNRAWAPGLYEAVRAVIRDDQGRIVLADTAAPAETEILDWVVVMRRFADCALLDDRAVAGELTPTQVVEAVEAVARVHAASPPVAAAGHPADYRHVLAGLRRTEAVAIGDAPSPSGLLFERLAEELERQGARIETRRRSGWVRRGHGDLHLRNICLFEGRVTPFDALEFDPALATADVLYDIAFLLMDLRARGLPDLANLAMNAYWDAAGQAGDDLALLPLFMGLRAAVRMAVAVRSHDLAEADRYRTLALHLLMGAHPRLVAVGGLSGSGKSTVARAIAPHLPGACAGRVLRTDLLRKAPEARPPAGPAPETDYGSTARRAVYHRLAREAAASLAAGASVVADATFRAGATRDEIAEAAGEHPFLGVWLDAGAAERARRVAARRDDASQVPVEIARHQRRSGELGAGWRIIDGGRTPALVLEDLRMILAAEEVGQP